MARGDVVLRRFLPRGKKVKDDAKRTNPVEGGRMKSAFSGNPRGEARPDAPVKKAPAKKAPAKKKAATKKAAAKKDK